MAEFDHNFKEFGAEDPRGLLHMTGSLPLEVAASVRPVSNELIAPQRAADHLCVVETPGAAWVEQLEALARWHSREIEAILARTKTASMVPDLRQADFRVTVVLLSEKDAPAVLPQVFRERRGRFGSFVVPRFVKLWELDPLPMLETGRRSLLPWISLMRGGERLTERIAGEIARRQDRDLASRFLTVASLRYDKKYIASLLEKGNMLLYTRELVEATPVGQDIYAYGVQKGLEKGRLEGQIDLLTRFIRLRFPNLAEHPALTTIATEQQAEALLVELSNATGEQAAHAALQRFVLTGA